LPIVYQNLPMPPTHRDVIVNAMVFVHQSMHKANERETARGAHTVSVTPRSYLDFINHYVSGLRLTYKLLEVAYQMITSNLARYLTLHFNLTYLI